VGSAARVRRRPRPDGAAVPGQLRRLGVRGGSSVPSWTPLDLEETDDAYLAELDLPGVNKHDLTVEMLGGEIRVHGEIKERERTGVLRRQSRQVGVVEHRFTLPGEVDAGPTGCSPSAPRRPRPPGCSESR
jgi:HSP20 family molecular chaperone IbpA